MMSNRSKTKFLFTTVTAAALSLTLGATPAMADSGDGYEPIGMDGNDDGTDDYWIISKDGGKTYDGIYTTEGAADKAARKADRVARRIQRKLARGKKKAGKNK